MKLPIIAFETVGNEGWNWPEFLKYIKKVCIILPSYGRRISRHSLSLTGSHFLLNPSFSPRPRPWLIRPSTRRGTMPNSTQNSMEIPDRCVTLSSSQYNFLVKRGRYRALLTLVIPSYCRSKNRSLAGRVKSAFHSSTLWKSSACPGILMQYVQPTTIVQDE